MKYYFILALVFMTGCNQNKSQKDIEFEFKKSTSQEYVKPYPSFSVTLVGDGPDYTVEYKKIWKMSLKSNANEEYLKMVNSNDLSKKMYGLVGLKLINSSQYAKKRSVLLKSTRKIAFGEGGCMFFVVNVNEVIGKLDSKSLENPFN